MARTLSIPAGMRLLRPAFLILTLLPGLAAPTASAQATERVLMAVFAHPDDESLVGPILKKYADEGVHVILVTATDGRLGSTDFSGIPPGDELAAVRREELQCAASTLGVDELIHLEYYDQFNSAEGFDGFIPQLQGLLRDLREIIREHQPDAIITFGPDGVTNHMDHRLVGSSVTQVILSQEWERRPDVYYFGVPASRLPEEERVLRGTQDEYLTMRIAFTDEQRDTGLEAMRCHASQFQPEAIEEMMAYLAGEENITYLRPLVVPTPQATDLFE